MNIERIRAEVEEIIVPFKLKVENTIYEKFPTATVEWVSDWHLYSCGLIALDGNAFCIDTKGLEFFELLRDVYEKGISCSMIPHSTEASIAYYNVYPKKKE